MVDLLHRGHESELEGEIVGVLSNHSKLSKLASWYGMPFKQVSIHQATKNDDIAKMSKAINTFNPDVIVLARYVQIILKDLCNQYKYKIINIHHSFLPSFAGANPYSSAAQCGVKLIGETCH